MKTLKPIATFIFEVKDSFTNAVKSIVRQDADGNDYVDWRIDRNSVLSRV